SAPSSRRIDMADNKQTVLTDEQNAIIAARFPDDPASACRAQSAIVEILSKLRAVGEPVAWRDPDNLNPGQSVTFDPETAAKWPHIYRQPLYAASQVSAQPWQALAAAMYQAAGAYDMPVRFLDALSAAANGEDFA